MGWRRYEAGVWGDSYGLEKHTTHAPSAAVGPDGTVLVAVRLPPYGRVAVGVLHPGTKKCDWQVIEAVKYVPTALDLPTLVVTDETHAQLFYLTQNLAWTGRQDSPRRTVAWYTGKRIGKVWSWEAKGFIGANPAGTAESIRSRLAALSLGSKGVMLAGIDTQGRLVWRNLDIGAPYAGAWDTSNVPKHRGMGAPCLVKVWGEVWAAVRTRELEAGKVYRARLDPLPVTWQAHDFPHDVSGDVSACAHNNDELFVFGRACKLRSALHGTVTGQSTGKALGRIYDSEGGRMIDVRAVTLGDAIWLFARGYDLKLYCRRIQL